MPDIPLQAPETGQYVAAAEHTIRAAAGLDPLAQTVLAAGLCLAVVAWIVTRRPPPGPGAETFTIVVKAMEEQARATAALAEQVEKVVEQNAFIISELRGGAVLRR
jgi:hypothetical protein